MGASSLSSPVTPEALENAAKEVDRQLAADRQFPELSEQINASQSKHFLSFVLPVMWKYSSALKLNLRPWIGLLSEQAQSQVEIVL